jgi:putative transposase
MQKTYKYRLYPNPSQEAKMNATLEGCRIFYNLLLEQRIKAWRESRKNLSAYDQMKMHSGCSKEIGIYSQILQRIAIQLDGAFKNFYRRPKCGFPRFKGKNRLDSFCFPQNGWKLEKDKITISKIGTINIILHRPLKGKIKQLIIKKWNNQWYACFSVETEPKDYGTATEAVGIDVGIKKFAVFSDGTEIENPRFFKRDQKELARVQRNKNKKAITIIHQRICNRRLDFTHQLTTKIVKNYSEIFVEKLNKKGMKSFREINRALSDVAWGKFRELLKYKAEEAGRVYKELNPANTTRKCYNCGNIVKKQLKNRWHFCPRCGISIDRDLNAALNLLALGHQCVGIETIKALS